MSKLPENTEIKLKKRFLSTGVIKLLTKIVIILSFLMAAIVTISVFFLQNTIMQVDFEGVPASG